MTGIKIRGGESIYEDRTFHHFRRRPIRDGNSCAGRVRPCADAHARPATADGGSGRQGANCCTADRSAYCRTAHGCATHDRATDHRSYCRTGNRHQRSRITGADGKNRIGDSDQ
jgi:hypothetical protein